MPFAWFVALRYLRTDRSQTGLILAAVSVGVTVIIFLSALISGLQASLIEKTLGSQPHITIHRPREAPRPVVEATPDRAVVRTVEPSTQRLRSIDQWPRVLQTCAHIPGVLAASPVVVGAGFAVEGTAKEPIVVRAIDPDRSLPILDFRRRMTQGRFDVSGDNVALGATLAANLGLRVGDKLRVTTTENVQDTLTVTGIFALGNEAVDRSWVVTSLRHGQALYGLPGGATAIELKVDDVFLADDLAAQARDRTGLEADSWMKLNAELLAGLRAQSSSKFMIQFFVILAVALGIASVMVVSVVQKSKEIGILRANGTATRPVLMVFLIQGGVLGLCGALLGSMLGSLFAKLFEQAQLEVGGNPRFPVTVDLTLMAGSVALAVGVGLLAALLPAVRAARLDPATAIRNG